MRVLFFITTLLVGITAFAQNKKYYVNASGNDHGDGTIDRPWKTVNTVNNFNFQPGDSLFFAGGQTFGLVDLKSTDAGLSITSYNGVSKLGGLYAYNVGDISITNINFYGPGTTGNNVDVIFFYMDSLATSDLYNLTFRNINITNFGASGLIIGAWYTNYGYKNVEVSNSNLYGNGVDGFASYGYNDYFNHANLHLNNVKSYQNYGRLDLIDNRTGSGFTIGGFNGGLIENCEAYENGKNNRHSTGDLGAPQGIWCYNSRSLTFQYCSSHDNHAGL